MPSNVYWTTTAPVTVPIAGVPTDVVFLRFGVTTGAVPDRVNQWKNYCPLPVTIGGFVQSQAYINGNAADDAIRRLLLDPNVGQPTFTLSIPNTVIDWFVVAAAQPNGVAVGALVQAAMTANIPAGQELNAGNIRAVVTQMFNTINH